MDSDPKPATEEKKKEDGEETKDKKDGEEEDDDDEEEDENAGANELDELMKEMGVSDSEQARLRQQEDERKAAIRAAERRIERDREMHEGVTLRHTGVKAPFNAVTVAEGVQAWTDRRQYTYTDIPEEMIDAVCFPGSFKKTATGVFTLEFAMKGTAFIWCDRNTNEVPQVDGGFPRFCIENEWEPCGSMKYADGREQVEIWKKEFHKPGAEEIPVEAPWKGGIAFKMAPDGLPTPPESEKPPTEEEKLSCLTRFCRWLGSLDPVESLDVFLTRWNPLPPLERYWTKRNSQNVRQAVEQELKKVWDKDRRGRRKGNPSGRQEFSEDLVREVYHRLRPKHAAPRWKRALACQMSPRATIMELCWRFCLVVSLGLILFLCLALGALSSQDVVVHPDSGALSGPVATDQPVATSATVRLRPIWEYPQLELHELRRLEDVMFSHNKATHVMRISSLMKMADGTLVLRTTDGSKIRIQPSGMAFWRQHGTKSEEVFLEDMEAWRLVNGTQETAWMTSGVLSEQLVMQA